jgi:GWxTD domain-containing protein
MNITKLFNNSKVFLRCFTVLLFFISFLNYSKAQNFGINDKSFYYDSRTHFYCEVHVLPHGITDSSDVFIIFRIANSALPFAKYKNKDDIFAAYPSIEIEYKDSTGIIRRRSGWIDTIIANSSEEIHSSDKFTYGHCIETFDKGKFNINVKLSTNDDIQLKKLNFQDISINTLKSKNFISEPVFVYFGNVLEQKKSYILYLLNGSIGFSSDIPHILFQVNSDNENKSYIYSLERLKAENAYYFDDSLFVSQQISVQENKSIQFQFSGKGILLNIDDLTDKIAKITSKFGIIDIEIPNQHLYPGNYLLKLIRPQSNDTLKYKFKVEWKDMPRSLKKVDFAANIMYYILTDDEFKKLNKGSQEEVSHHIIDYWKMHDPTPYTAYNEAMTEYFRRVDYAFFNFQTFTEKDGANSDRGKIYILYSKPSSVEQSLTNNKSFEKWRYDKLKKEFIFETVSSGIYKLSSINELK